MKNIILISCFVLLVGGTTTIVGLLKAQAQAPQTHCTIEVYALSPDGVKKADELRIRIAQIQNDVTGLAAQERKIHGLDKSWGIDLDNHQLFKRLPAAPEVQPPPVIPSKQKK